MKRHSIQHPALRPAALRAFLALCLCHFWQEEAQAAAFLAIRSFSQSVGASYSFHRSATSAAGSSAETEQETSEDYGAGFDYVVLAPRLLRGNCMLDLEWLQNDERRETGATGTSKFQLRYNINGNLLSRSPYPASFSAHSSRETISLPFTPTYQSQADAFQANVSLLNNFVPSDISVSQQSQETSGLVQDVRQKSHSLAFGARPNFGDLGSLTLGVTLTQSDSTLLNTDETTHNASATSHFGYHSTWKSERGLTRSVSLVYGYQQSQGVTSLNQQNLNGGLSWQLGKVMDSSFNYFSSKSAAPEQTMESRGMTGMLSHKLMGSLITSVYASTSSEEFQAGDNGSYGGGINFAYSKKLPEASNVSVNYGYGMNFNEHNGNVASVRVFSERHEIPVGPAPRIRLDHPTFQPETIQVVGTQSQLVYPASFYLATAEGVQLVERYDIDTELQVTYNYRQDPSLTTLGTSHTASASVNLFANKYRVYTNFRATDQKLVDGDPTSLTLTGSRHYDIGATANLHPHNLSAELGYDQDYAQDLYYLNSSWNYGTSFQKGELTLGVNDRYSWQTTEHNGRQMWTNSFNAQSGYRRRFGYVEGRFKASYANALSGGGGMYQIATFGSNLEGRFGKLTALLNANASWTFSSAGNSSSQGVTISLRRSF